MNTDPGRARVKGDAETNAAPVLGSDIASGAPAGIEHGTWIRFVPGPPRPRTRTWFVMTASGAQIGEIRWFPRWRCYGYWPTDGSVYEAVCLREIAEFCERATAAHKAARPPVKRAKDFRGRIQTSLPSGLI